jgi:hypothetical protein
MKTRLKLNAVVVVTSSGTTYSFNPTWTPQLYTDMTSEAGKSDQAWFKNNPYRRHHLRTFMDGDDCDFRDHFFVLRKDQAGLRIIPVLAEFTPPDEEDFAEVLYLMSLEAIAASARAVRAGADGEARYMDLDQYLTRVLMRQKLRGLLP